MSRSTGDRAIHTICASDIKPAKNIIDYFKGNATYFIENKWCAFGGVARMSSAQFLKQLDSKSSFGFSYAAPSLFLVKDGACIAHHRICWTPDSSTPKDYRFGRRFANKSTGAPIPRVAEEKVFINVTKNDPLSIEDECMLMIGFQLACAMEMALIADILDIDISTLNSDTDFIDAAIVKLGVTDGSKAYTRIRDDVEQYIKTVNDGKYFTYTNKMIDDAKTLTDAFGSRFSKLVSSSAKYQKINRSGKISGINAGMTYGINTVRNEGTNETRVYINVDMRAKLGYCDVANQRGTFLEPYRVTQFGKRALKYDDYTMLSAGIMRGAIWIRPFLSFGYYGQGGPSVSFSVTNMALKAVQTQVENAHFDHGAFESFIDDDDDDEVVSVKSQTLPPVADDIQINDDDDVI